MSAPPFSNVGIDVPYGATGELRLPCPQCSSSRRKSRDACLAVNADGGNWLCHHCGWKGSVRGHTSATPLPPLPRPHAWARADEGTLDAVYGAMLAELILTPRHHHALRQRGLDDTTIRQNDYRTLPIGGRAALARRLIARYGGDVCTGVPGFSLISRDDRTWWSVAGATGLLIPVRNLHGQIVALKVRADDAGDGPKYTSVSSTKHRGPGPGAPVHVPLHARPHDGIVRLTEGELKADVATAWSGLLTISIPGVAMWRTALPVLQALGAQHVLLAFDADWRSNPHVGQALGAAALALMQGGYTVETEVWDPAHGKGIDDILAAGQRPERQGASVAFGAGLWQRAVSVQNLAALPTQEVRSVWHH